MLKSGKPGQQGRKMVTKPLTLRLGLFAAETATPLLGDSALTEQHIWVSAIRLRKQGASSLALFGSVVVAETPR